MKDKNDEFFEALEKKGEEMRKQDKERRGKLIAKAVIGGILFAFQAALRIACYYLLWQLSPKVAIILILHDIASVKRD